MRLCLCGWTPLCPAEVCGNLVATCTSVDMDISMDIHAKISSVDDMDMDGKFHIHGKPENNRYE